MQCSDPVEVAAPWDVEIVFCRLRISLTQIRCSNTVRTYMYTHSSILSMLWDEFLRVQVRLRHLVSTVWQMILISSLFIYSNSRNCCPMHGGVRTFEGVSPRKYTHTYNWCVNIFFYTQLLQSAVLKNRLKARVQYSSNCESIEARRPLYVYDATLHRNRNCTRAVQNCFQCRSDAVKNQGSHQRLTRLHSPSSALKFYDQLLVSQTRCIMASATAMLNIWVMTQRWHC